MTAIRPQGLIPLLAWGRCVIARARFARLPDRSPLRIRCFETSWRLYRWRWSEIDAAFAAREWQALWQATHKLQGAAAICSLPALHAALVELARAARNPDSPGLANALAGVRHEVDRLIKA